MTLRISNLTECPPGGFRYRIPEDGKLVGPHIVFRDLLAEVRRHYALTERLAPADLDDKVHAFMCAQIGPTYCRDADANRLLAPNPRSTLPIRFHSVVQGTKTIGEWFVKGRLLHQLSLVPSDQSTARATTCVSCPHNVQVGGCAACVAGQLTRAITAIVGNATTPLDSNLRACDLCGCSLRAKVWFPLSLLRKHMTDDQLAAFPPHCWLVTEHATTPQS